MRHGPLLTSIIGETATKKIGKYEIIRELGRGAMGVVFKARDPLIGRLVALKTIALAASQSDDLRQRFYREAQAAGGLQHPNIVTVYEMGEEESVPFIAMEYLEGESLDTLLGRGMRVPLAQKLGYVVQVSRALSYAHQHGIVHRDIKPGNIVITRDQIVKVVDFGIARIADTSKTQTGVLLGTLAYMSPQLVKGERADERSDLWATGVVSYELFGGLKPFDGENHAALLMSIVTEEPRPLAKVAPDCPDELRAIIEKMLRKNAEERYKTFEELLRDIEPLWRRHQRECVDFLLAQSKDLIRRGESLEARKILLQARVVDATRTLSREMLEKINVALKDELLPLEVAEHLERARNLRSEGLLEEAKAAARSALDLDSKSESARQLAADIAREIELLQEARRRDRAPAVERLLDAMRAAIERGDPSGALRLGREALGRAGQDTRVSELVELAEQKLRERGGDASRHGPSGPAKPGSFELELYAKSDESEALLREYVFERASLQTGGSSSSLPEVTAQVVESTKWSAASGTQRIPLRSSDAQEAATKKQVRLGSGTMAVEQPVPPPTSRPWWKAPIAYVIFAAVAGAAIITVTMSRRPNHSASPSQVAIQQTNPVSLEQPKVSIVQPGDSPALPTDAKPTPRKNEEELLFAEAQQLARSSDSATLRQAQHSLDTVIAKNGAFRPQAEQLREDVLRRLSKNEQELQRNSQFSALATQARQDLDAGDTAAARQKLTEIRSLGGNDETLTAEIDRTERARFASLESQYQQDVQSADDRARNHLGDLQRQFRALAASGGPVADTARNYAENLIPAKISEIGAKPAPASTGNLENQAFESAVKEYKKFLDARDASSLKNVALPKFQSLAQGGGPHVADARQYVDNLIPAALRQLAPYPAVGCAEVPSGLAPSVKSGELVACGLLDQPRLKWTQFAWPEFPAKAHQAGQSKGVAMLTLTVDENGSVVDAKPRGSPDAYGFTDAALHAAQSWKTSPPRAQSKPVRTQFSVDISFSQ